jgi:TonB family protein
MRTPQLPGTPGSSLELLSDPMGVDFKPYLIQILARVRKNWFAVIPETARMGNRGVVLLQFIIDHDGQVPKLVIALPSGAESLDRAAVASISASVPFPPLPKDFKGKEVRLQFSFKYNVK